MRLSVAMLVLSNGLLLAGESPPSEVEVKNHQVMERARQFFEDLIAGNPVALVEHAAFPFYLDSKKITQPRDLLQEGTRNLSHKRTNLLVLYGIEVLTPVEMEKKYGRPPRRLSSLPWRAPDAYLAVANLSGRAAVIILRPVEGTWRVFAFHD